MAIDDPAIFEGKVMHHRFFPKQNGFVYKTYNILLSLDKEPPSSLLPKNKISTISFHPNDHGGETENFNDLETWARGILRQYKIDKADGQIRLMAMPRIFGYVFNPVSFWLCYDKQENLRAVIAEVRNTFSEKHVYLCAHSDQRPITKEETIEAEKLFHVSPFLHRHGHYEFRFHCEGEKIAIWIDYYHENGQKQLATSLIGTTKPMTKKSLNQTLWRYPLITLKTIMLIHWQALKLVTKGIRYISKPSQHPNHTSASRNIKKN
jgi:DUF1365 family protein